VSLASGLLHHTVFLEDASEILVYNPEG
jgi:hypothetical protein